MKFCRDHWTELRNAVESKGMGHLIKKTPEEAMQTVMKDLKGTSDIIDYDPLMSCYWNIMAQSLKAGGIYLMMVDENGNEFCPLCELNKHCSKEQLLPGEVASTTWIQGCTDAALNYCQENGLVPIKEVK